MEVSVRVGDGVWVAVDNGDDVGVVEFVGIGVFLAELVSVGVRVSENFGVSVDSKVSVITAMSSWVSGSVPSTLNSQPAEKVKNRSRQTMKEEHRRDNNNSSENSVLELPLADLKKRYFLQPR